MAEKSPQTPSPNVAREKALRKPTRRDLSPLAKNQVFMTRSRAQAVRRPNAEDQASASQRWARSPIIPLLIILRVVFIASNVWIVKLGDHAAFDAMT